MSCLHYLNNELYIENVSLNKIANEFGTPCYVYSRAALESNWRQFATAFDKIPRQICYAVKANSNVHLLKLLAEWGAGFDIVSEGELERVLVAGGKADSIIFSGVGKQEREIKRALSLNIKSFNVESLSELDKLKKIASEMNKRIRIAFRINPNVNAKTHAHIATGLASNKFGIEPDQALKAAQAILNSQEVELVGIATHIGSQITDLEPFLTAMDVMINLHDKLTKMGHHLHYLDMGGGLGITYHEENPPNIQMYADKIQAKMQHCKSELILEPGRAIVGNAGILLTKVQYLKPTPHKNFAIVDAGMNDLLRPALYDAWQNILPVKQHNEDPVTYDIAGPVCESADYLGKNRALAIHENDYLAVDAAGAYGFSMSSNYNSRPRAAEILVSGEECKIIRRRESLNDLMRHELER